MTTDQSPCTKLSVLDDVRIASPCDQPWDGMSGTDTVRFCGSCEKKVYNLSALTRRSAEALLARENGDLCLRLYRRADGTVLTDDCPVALRFARHTLRGAVRLGWLVRGALLATLSLAAFGLWRNRQTSTPAAPGIRVTVTPPPVAQGGWSMGGPPAIQQPVPPPHGRWLTGGRALPKGKEAPPRTKL